MTIRTMRRTADGGLTMAPRPSLKARIAVDRIEEDLFAAQDDCQGPWTPAFRERFAEMLDMLMKD